MIQRLRVKFVAINMAIVTMMLCVIFALVLYFTSSSLEGDSIRMMESIAAQPFQLSVPDQMDEEVRLPFFSLRLGPHGELLEAGGGYYDLSDSAFLDQLISLAYASPKKLGVIQEYNLRYYRMDTSAHPCVVFADISSEMATMESLRSTCLVLGVISFFAFLLISILLSRWAVKPVDAAWKRQRQFVAAASHELKTPLTVITTNAELLQSPEYDEDTKNCFSDSILTMSHQMRRLIEQMLTLARTDQAETQEVFSPVDLSRLTEQAALPFEPVFYEKGMRLVTEISAGIQVAGDSEQLRQIVDILLDNAQKYARSGGTTWISLQKKARGRCLLTVSDEGPSIPPEELEHIFERFYRADPARSRTGSFGLGLSIAEGIVTRHHGKIWAESRDGINRFLVELPCV